MLIGVGVAQIQVNVVDTCRRVVRLNLGVWGHLALASSTHWHSLHLLGLARCVVKVWRLEVGNISPSVVDRLSLVR